MPRTLNDYIYSTVPEKAIKPMKDRQVILRVLQKNRLLTAIKIAKIAGWPTRGTQVEVRKAITELIELDGHPIISGSDGFMLATTKAQLLDYIEQLEHRKQGLQRRIDKIGNIYHHMEG